MTRHEGPIVVGIDGTALIAGSVTAAIELGAAEAERRHVDLHLVHSYAAETTTAVTTARQTLDQLVDRTVAAYPDLDVTGDLRLGSAANALVAISATASIVVMCADARVHYGGLQAGLVSVQVAGHSLAPVIVVPAPRARPATGDRALVVVGIDGSPACADAIAFAFEEAAARDAVLHAVSAWNRPSQQDSPQRAVEEMLCHATDIWARKYPDVAVVCTAVGSTNPVQALGDAAANADLIVVGARGAGGFDALELGSVSDGLVRFARTNIAVVRNAG